MFGTIRRHQTWLWLIIATITIASFVIYFNPASRSGQGPRRTVSDLGTLKGRPITAEELSNASKEFRLRYFLSSGQRWPDPESVSVQREAYIHLFLISELKELDIEPGDTAVAELAARITGSMTVDDFVDKYLKPGGLNANDFDRFLRHELGIEQLTATAGLSGRMVTPQEAGALYRANHKELTTALVYFAATNFVKEVSVTPEAVTQYYLTNMNLRYHLRDRVQVDYVRFDNSNYFAKVAQSFTNLDKDVDAAYAQYGTNLFPGLTNEAEIKLKLKHNALNQRGASVEALRAAIAFAETLFNLPKSPESLEKLAETNKLKLLTTAPFDNDGIKDTNVPENFTQTAFQLTTNEPFGGPITNSDAAFVLALKRSLPSEIEPFDQIKDRVTADYRQAQAVELAQQAAVKFHTELTNGLAQSNRFDAICAAAKVKPEILPPFSLASTNLPADIEDRVGLGLLQRVAFNTLVGSASPVVPMPDGAFILHIARETPVDEAKVKAELPQFLAFLRQTRQTEAFNQWLNQRVNQDRDFVQIMQEFSKKLEAPNPNSRRAP